MHTGRSLKNKCCTQGVVPIAGFEHREVSAEVQSGNNVRLRLLRQDFRPQDTRWVSVLTKVKVKRSE